MVNAFFNIVTSITILLINGHMKFPQIAIPSPFVGYYSGLDILINRKSMLSLKNCDLFVTSITHVCFLFKNIHYFFMFKLFKKFFVKYGSVYW